MQNENKFELELSLEYFSELFFQVKKYTDDFLNKLPDSKTFYYEEHEPDKKLSHFLIDGEVKNIQQIFDILKTHLDKTGLNAASGGHLGYIPGGGISTAALGDFIAAITNHYAGVFYAGPGAVRMENAVIQWAGDLIGYQNNFGGNLCSGGSVANLIALFAAKSAKKIKSKQIEQSVIYATKQCHHSIFKALRFLGLDECVLHHIPLDEHYRMNISELKKQITADKKLHLSPFLIIANAGSTDVGAIDPLLEIATIAQEENIWFHIDAAYGGFFMLTEYGKNKLQGIEQADSVILDPHKSLFLPYGSGMVLVKNVQHLLEANSYAANYMQDAAEWNQELSPADLSPELTKHFRGLRIWLPLQLHGIKPFEDYLNEKLELISYFCTEIMRLGFELGNAPDLTVAIYRFHPKNSDTDTFNRSILKAIHQDGRVFISSTEIDGIFWLRIAILSFRTHKREIDILLELLRKHTIKN